MSQPIEQDETNFTSSSSHRLPTISAASALKALSNPERRSVSTGLPLLDEILAGSGLKGSNGGLSRGHVIEAYGPPGVGKTAFGLQAAANALYKGNSVVWIDTAHQLVGPRFTSIVSHFRWPVGQDPPSSPPRDHSVSDLLSKFHHFQAPTLPHLLALLAYRSPLFPPRDTSLIVIDSISTLFATAFPRAVEGFDSSGDNKAEAVRWASGRRWAVMGDFTARVNKVASVNNIAVLLLSQTSTKVKTEHGALLRPALSTKPWLESINTRLVLFRDFLTASGWPDEAQESANVRFVGIVKHAGVLYESLERVVPFVVDKFGVHPANVAPQTIMNDQAVGQLSVQLPVLPGKRKRGEVADSQSASSDDEFAWIEDDPLALLDEGGAPDNEHETDPGDGSNN